MGLKSAHFQESDFQESGEGDRPFSREIELSWKRSLCCMVRLLSMPSVFVAIDACNRQAKL